MAKKLGETLVAGGPQRRTCLDTCKGTIDMASQFRLERPVSASPSLVPSYRSLPGRAEGRALAGAFAETLPQPSLILDMALSLTGHSAAEREMAALLHHKDVLLREMQHRVANSLQIIASMLLLKARCVDSEETRRHLKDTHRRIISVATVQQQLDCLRHRGRIDLASYLSRLCDNLSASLVDDDRRVAIEVRADRGTVSSADGVSIGLIVTELVINALKHAFAADTAAGLIVVAYEVDEPGWRLTVSDNGVIGKPNGNPGYATAGLGTGIVEALARQLDGRVETSMVGPHGAGRSVTITHGPFE